MQCDLATLKKNWQQNHFLLYTLCSAPCNDTCMYIIVVLLAVRTWPSASLSHILLSTLWIYGWLWRSQCYHNTTSKVNFTDRQNEWMNECMNDRQPKCLVHANALKWWHSQWFYVLKAEYTAPSNFCLHMISSCSDRSTQPEVALSYYQCSSVYVFYSWADTYGSKWDDACMNAHNKLFIM